MERCRKLEKGLIGQQSERLGDDGAQLSLGVLELMFGDRAAAELELQPEEVQAIAEHTRKTPTGRKPIPEHLPRVDIVDRARGGRARGVGCV